jgi:hypothetical protein
MGHKPLRTDWGKLDTETMSTKFTITLALAAGFIGGLASRYLRPAQVYAQAPASPQDIRAQKFVLVDENGVARGVFGFEASGAPAIEIIDSKGEVFATEFGKWSYAYGAGRKHPPGPKHPTLLPIKP